MRPASLAACLDEAVGEEFAELAFEGVRVGGQLGSGLGERERFMRLKKRGQSGSQRRQQRPAGFILDEALFIRFHLI